MTIVFVMRTLFYFCSADGATSTNCKIIIMFNQLA